MAANSSSFPLNDFHDCWFSTTGVSIISSFLVTKFFVLLPLSLLVLYLGYHRWQQQRSFATTSHSDIFTYHSAVLELIYVMGAAFNFCGKYVNLLGLMSVGYYLCSVVVPGHTSLHILTCVERYLAVVHPVIYLRLRQSWGVRIRNISIGCVWLLCIGWIGFTALYSPDFPFTPYFFILVLFIAVESFCSLSILRVLIRPGPGEMGGNRERVHRSKRRAFNTITAIIGVQWLFIFAFVVGTSLVNSHVLNASDKCLVLMAGRWFAVPSGLVLPLLFLHRTGKLFYCHRINE